MRLSEASQEQLRQWETSLAAEYQQICQQQLSLDLTRGKPSADQLSLSDALDGILKGSYTLANGVDARNYGGIDGIGEMKQLGADLLGVSNAEVMAIGNSSLTLMYLAVSFALQLGVDGPDSAWTREGEVKFLCPVPGYDRHFAICEQLGITMINVPMKEDGPDMDVVEAMVKADPSIKGIWCVPKYSNPTGCVYSDDVVSRMAKLGQIAGPHFRIFWDNAYAVHDLVETPPALANLMALAKANGCEDSVYQFASTSKITHAGAGVAFWSASEKNLATIKEQLGVAMIGPDKVNQLRHSKLIPNMAALQTLMDEHRHLLRARFDAVISALEEHFADTDLGSWQVPQGGYFVSFDARAGLAKEIVRLAAEAGVKLTPAGATFPYGKDPQDCNIRLAPSFPPLADVEATMKVFATCVKLASVRQALAA